MSNNFSHLSTSQIQNRILWKHNTTQEKVFAFWSADLYQTHSSPSTDSKKNSSPLTGFFSSAGWEFHQTGNIEGVLLYMFVFLTSWDLKEQYTSFYKYWKQKSLFFLKIFYWTIRSILQYRMRVLQFEKNMWLCKGSKQLCTALVCFQGLKWTTRSAASHIRKIKHSCKFGYYLYS